MIDEKGRLDKLIERQVDMLGNAPGKAVTATLRVSPDGSGSDGLSWRTAYQTPAAALDAASTDTNDLTLILITPHPTYYDMNAPGIPSWSANVILQGTYRGFAEIRNSHNTGSAILRLTGKSVVNDLRFYQVDDNAPCNGLIMEGEGVQVHRCEFDGSALATDPGISLMMNSADRCKVEDCDFYGNTTYVYGLQVNSTADGNFERLRIHDCLTGIWVLNVTSDHNLFSYIDIGECAVAIDIDAGNEQFLYEIVFHHNTRNIDDEVGDSIWVNIHGSHPVYIHPDNFTGDLVNTNVAADTWGGDTEIIAAATVDNPFRVVAIQAEGSANEKFRVRFSADSAASHYDDIQIEGEVNAVKREVSVFPSQSVPIYNAGTRISASAKSESGGNNVWVWVEIQEL